MPEDGQLLLEDGGPMLMRRGWARLVLVAWGGWALHVWKKTVWDTGYEGWLVSWVWNWPSEFWLTAIVFPALALAAAYWVWRGFRPTEAQRQGTRPTARPGSQ